MKRNLSLASLALLVVTLSLLGCTSGAAHTRGDSTSSSLDSMAGLAAKARSSSLEAGSTLQAVIDSARTDPASAFTKFKDQVAALKSSRDALYSKDAALKSLGSSYLAEWEKNNATIADADLKQVGEQRRADLQAALADVDKPMTALRTRLDSFVAGVEDMQKYLSSDLTPAGIDAVSGKAKKFGKEAKGLEDLFEDLESALNKAAPKFKVAKPPPAQPPAEKK